MNLNFFGKIFGRTLLFVFLFEIISYLGHFLPFFKALGFVSLFSFAFVLICYRFEYGVYILLAELFVGSMGRLFAIDIFGFSLSIRIALWILVMIFWGARIIFLWNKGGKKGLSDILHGGYFAYFMVMFFVIFWGIVNAAMRHNPWSNIINDANAWLYFAVFFPIFFVFSEEGKTQQRIKDLLEILLASSLWISLKTFFVVYVFSHKMIFTMPELYTWIRDTRIGEITNMSSGFVRVFFQSHIFVLASSFLILFLLTDFLIRKREERACLSLSEKKLLIVNLFLLSLFWAVNILGLSRSNWVGTLVGLVCFFSSTIVFYSWKKIFLPLSVLIGTFFCAYILILGVIHFPFPGGDSGISASDILSDRAGNISGEAGASSRFALLPKLWGEIKTEPILGKGFGATVTYKSSDPRILEKDPSGAYTTFAFEWGWLDIWLKLGLFGVLFYLYFLFVLIFGRLFKYYKNRNSFSLIEMSFLLGLVVISCVSFFSPYLNHPLGITYLIITATILDINKKS